MTDKTIYITEEDRIKLKKLVTYSGGYRFFDKKTLGELKIEIERAKVIKNKESIDGIITMNSKVRLKDLDSGLEFTYTLVYPDKANISENRISILAPIGTAILGYKTGEIIEWIVPAGKRRLEVIEVMHPELSEQDNN
ncbi:MAG: GreA/GreB family elongation factor [Melioribacteraceae bacterium]|nr:transcription elongation factor GreAB [Ignavibacteriota bacterium]MBZ0182354.1 GreA/GreB family elongation factor [Melioribacteraceae bacterium]